MSAFGSFSSWLLGIGVIFIALAGCQTAPTPPAAPAVTAPTTAPAVSALDLAGLDFAMTGKVSVKKESGPYGEERVCYLNVENCTATTTETAPGTFGRLNRALEAVKAAAQSGPFRLMGDGSALSNGQRVTAKGSWAGGNAFFVYAYE